MNSHLFSVGAAALLSAAVSTATAQPAPPPAPAAASAVYQSALSGYRSYADQPVQSWREANDRVGRIGGWKAYAKESQGGSADESHQGHDVASPGAAARPAADSSAPATPSGASGGHGNHGTHKSQ